MSKLYFFVFIFAIFAFTCDHIIEVVAPKGDEPSSTTSGSTSNRRPPPVPPSTSKTHLDSSASPSYEPLILIMNKDETDTLLPINTDVIITPFSNTHVVSEKQLNNQLNINKEKIYFCPHGTWLEKSGRESKPYLKHALFKKDFGQDKVHQCSIKPQYIVKRERHEKELNNCNEQFGLEHYSSGVSIGFPLIKEEIPNSEKKSFSPYTKGIEELMENVDSGKIQVEDIKVKLRIIEMYEICYNFEKQRTYSIIRRIPPWAQHTRNRPKQEELYARKDKNKPQEILHKIVPSEEHSFEIWEQVTSDEPKNYVVVWLKLKPLIDLIDERLEKYSKKVSRWIKVMTKLVYYENVVAYQKSKWIGGNHTYYRPELLIVQAYDNVVKSAITIVIHNSHENAPQGSPYCEKTAVKCDFMQWIEESSVFKKYINDELTKFAYCCGSTNGMLANTEKVLEINWSSPYEPLILMVKGKQIDTLFPIQSSEQDDIPFNSIQILSEKQATELRQNGKKMYFCPHGTWLNTLNFEDTHYTQFALLEKRFDEEDAQRCSIQPQYMRLDIKEEYQPLNCPFKEGLSFQYVEMVIAYPLIKEKILETKKEVYKRYIEGIDELINNLKTGTIKRVDIKVALRMIDIYQLCYNKERKKTYWVIREITPWAQVTRDLEKQEKLYAQGDENEPQEILHKVVPSEENSFKIWERVTSEEPYNHVLVWLKLKPLIDLIDERLEKYSKQVLRWIKVMTKLVYHENVTEEEVIQRENTKYWRPETLLVQAYDEDKKSGITFVIHNSLNEPPQEKLYCKEAAECNFMTWFETSSIFTKYINDSVTKFAYCCKTMKDEFPMLLDIEIKEVMEMNWNSTSSPTM